ncbi:hypothetical protein ACFWMR_04510 [Amycolatopsis thailandensis]|uniref:hypothetical protein n=1 Tax=Amycolatopsis thailandensis TaxID=589330 RepID=UPI003668BCB9
MTNTESWSIACRDVTGRERELRVAVRDSEVVVVTPSGGSAILDYGAAVEFRSAVVKATEVVAAPMSATSDAVTTTDTTSTAEQNLGDLPPIAEERPDLSSCRGGAMTPLSGPAAIPAAEGEGA